MSYLDIERIQEMTRTVFVNSIIEAVKHRVSLSPELRADPTGDKIYDLWNELYDREAERIANDVKQDGYERLVQEFPQCDGPSVRDREQKAAS
jgi:hypothetical protein